MPKIKCTAKKCIFNTDNSCNRSQIAVERKAFCDSFEYIEKNYDIEIADFEKTSETKEIWCDAVKCVYLKTGKCNAKAIDVRGEHALKSKETNCNTFTNKDGN